MIVKIIEVLIAVMQDENRTKRERLAAASVLLKHMGG